MDDFRKLMEDFNATIQEADDVCPVCDGAGIDHGTEMPCKACDGTGHKLEEDAFDDAWDIVVGLEEVKEQMMDLAEHALSLIPEGVGEGGQARARAESYWHGHIMAALGNESYGGSMHSLQDTINEIQQHAREEAKRSRDEG